jgi:hypothetical protein
MANGTDQRNGIAIGLGSIMSVAFPAQSPSPPAAPSYLLLEDSSFVLLEDSSKVELE